jgi:hypothetical protein
MERKPKRTMIVAWPEDINRKIVEKQLELEKDLGKRVLKPDAAIALVHDLMAVKPRKNS